MLAYPPGVPPVVLTLALLAVAGLIATQIALPRIAARRLADALRRSGDIDEVRVRAVPALKLLFDRADVVEIWMIEARTGSGSLGDVLEGARRAGRLDAHAARARVGPLVMRDVRISMHGDAVRAQAAVTEADLAAVLPRGIALRPVAAGDGELLLEASAGLLGFRAALRARLTARDGALVIAPEGVLGMLGALTLLQDPRLHVTGVDARAAGRGIVLAAHGRLATVG